MRLAGIHRMCVLLLLFGAAVLVSCSDRSEVQTEPQKKTVQIRVSAALSEDDSDLDVGNTGELAVNSLRVYAFVEGKPAGYHYQGSPVRGNFLMDIKLYGVDPSTGCQTVDFYIIANEAGMVVEEDMSQLNANTSQEQLQNFRFIALNTNAGLPRCTHRSVELNMVAVRDIGSLDSGLQNGHEGHQLLSQELSFSIERPIAKLTFSAARRSADNPVIKSLVMLARGTRRYNYLMPQDVNFLKTLSPRVNDRPLLDENVSFLVDNTEAEGYQEVATAYCSECPFGSPSWDLPNQDNSVVLRLEFSIGEGNELRRSDIYMPQINRNEWVKVNCTISGEGQVSVNYNVKDWEYEMTDTNGDGVEDFIIFDYPTHTYLLPHMPTPENPEPDPNGPVKVLPQMSVSKPFTCYFQMLYPEGQMWKPTIISSDVSSSDFEISVYDGDTDVLALPDDEGSYGLNASHSSYYRIEVRPLEASNVGKSLRLGITSEIQGFGHSEYLLINGSQAELFWPSEGGEDPNALKITQIE